MSVRFLAVAALTLFLAGCGEGQQTMEQFVKTVQGYSVELCKFLPTAASVTAIVKAGDPATTAAFGVAQAICVVVTRQASTATLYKEECPKVNGVCVEGTYVDKK